MIGLYDSSLLQGCRTLRIPSQLLASHNGTLQSQVITGFSADIEAFFDKEKNLAELRATVR